MKINYYTAERKEQKLSETTEFVLSLIGALLCVGVGILILAAIGYQS